MRSINPFSKRGANSSGNPHRDRWELNQFDIHVSSTKVRRMVRRRRIVRLVHALIIIGILAGAGYAGKYWYDQVFYQNEEFVLKRLHIQSDGFLTEAQIAEVAEVSTGQDLMDIDLKEVRSRIASLASVKETVISREMPDRLEIKVSERTPVAWLSCPPQGIRARNIEQGFLLDREGHVFRTPELTESLAALPVVESLRISRPTAGAVVESEDVKAALNLIIKSDRMFEGRGLEVAEVRTINEWSLECLYRDGMRVSFGKYDYERGLNDLFAIVKKMKLASLQLATVDLVVSKNIPVTFQGDVDTKLLGDKVSRSSQSKEAEEESKGEEAEEKHLRSILKGG